MHFLLILRKLKRIKFKSVTGCRSARHLLFIGKQQLLKSFCFEEKLDFICCDCLQLNCLFTNKGTLFCTFWQNIINKSDYLHWVKYTRQIYQLYTMKHTKMNWNNANITHTKPRFEGKSYTGKVTQVWWLCKRKARAL